MTELEVEKVIMRRNDREVTDFMILETERLYLREMNQADFNSLCKILQDEETMYAYEGAFSDNEVQDNDRYLDKALQGRRYAALSLCHTALIIWINTGSTGIYICEGIKSCLYTKFLR